LPYDNAKRKLWVGAGYPKNLGSAAAALPPSVEYVRLYNLMPAAHLKSNITSQWIKVSRLSDVNDPFELLALSIMDPSVRAAVLDFKADEDSQTALLCFSEDWTSPLMWSHYADKHRGICLGFDVLRSAVKSIQYDDKRIRGELGKYKTGTFALTDELRDVLRYTKCHEWKYEKERRHLMSLASAVPHGALHFRPLDATIRLAEVILGPLCTESLTDIRALVDHHCPGVITFKARLAWKHFKVVPYESLVP
jgi:Protein of unknown function (DUF2971)